MKYFIIAMAVFVAIGRILIAPRLTGIPSAEGSYEAIAHMLVGFLIFVPFYDRAQQAGPSRLFGAIGWLLVLWEAIWFFAQKHAATVALLGVMTVLTGCAGMNQLVAAKESSGKVAVQTANDNIATGLEDALCDLPYGTVVRTQKIQPAVVSVCGAVTVQFPMQISASAK